jgi:hypothetical protein
MSQPYPTRVEVVDLKQHGLGFAGWTGGGTGGVLMEKMKGNGYSLTVGAAGKLSFTDKGPGPRQRSKAG